MTKHNITYQDLHMGLYDRITELQTKIAQLFGRMALPETLRSNFILAFERYYCEIDAKPFKLPSFPELKNLMEQIIATNLVDRFAVRAINYDIKWCEQTIRYEIIEHLYVFAQIVNNNTSVFTKGNAARLSDLIDEITLSLSFDNWQAPYICEHIAEIRTWMNKFWLQTPDTFLKNILDEHFEEVQFLFGLIQ